MFLLWLIFLLIISSAEGSVDTVGHSIPSVSFDHRINVAVSERASTAVRSVGKSNNLGLVIIENFAKKLKLEVEYFTVDTSISLNAFSNTYILK